MEKSKLYTCTGDTGTTQLASGERVDKFCRRIEAYGTLDEFSSHLALLATFDDNPLAVKSLLLGVQHRLFDVGAYLATGVKEGEQPAIKGLCEEDLKDVEHSIDALDAEVPPQKGFILPGGTRASAEAHIARTVCRRCERRILALKQEAWVDPLVLRYINRLSDWLFILARYYNHAAGVSETLWQAAAR